MLTTDVNPLRKLGILAIVAALALTAVSCSSDDPAAPADDDPPANRAPGVPVIDTAEGAPGDGAEDIPASVTLHWDCTDADGDVLAYTVHFGDTNTPPAVSIDQAANSYGAGNLVEGTTYYWQIVAKDPDGETTASPVWSFTTAAVIPEVETVSTPSAPTGPITGEVGESLTFAVTGSTSSEGHTVEYEINWGGATSTSFFDGSQASHAWDTAGTYEVTAKARCVTHPDIVSATSAALTVTIQAEETVTTPNAPDGPTTGLVDVQLYYDLSGAESSMAHNVEYRVDWGNGSISSWSTGTALSASWAAPGTYEVLAQARCSDHPEVVSDWSAATTVVISLPAEQIDVPELATYTQTGGVGDQLEFAVYGGNSNLGHPTEFQFDWGDGTYSDWGPKDGVHYTRTHAWQAVGTYQISARARCIEHPENVSEWMAAQPVEIMVIETVSAPFLNPQGEVTRNVGAHMGGIYAYGSESNMGHAVEEYQFDVNGTLTEWVLDQYLPSDAVPSDVPIDYSIKARARCVVHPDVISDWSATTLIHIVAE